MATPPTAEDVFRARIKELETLIEFSKLAITLKRYLGDLIRWEGIDNDKKALVRRILDLKEVDLQETYRSTLVLAMGCFEEFTRHLLTQAIASLNAQGLGFDAIDNKLKTENIRLTGVVFSRIYEPADHVEFDKWQLSQNIGTVIPNSKKSVLNADVFGLFLGQLTAETLDKALGRIGVPLDWDTIAQDTKIQNHFRLPKGRDLANKCKHTLDDLTKLRNKIAHTGGTNISVSEQETLEALGFIEKLGNTLAALVKRRMAIPKNRQSKLEH